ncbi:MAG: type ISP restriction/modification enzyme [Cytophagales bacterium]
MKIFQSVLDKYRKISFSERDKGERFERLMQAFLLTDPKYANLFKKVWLWNEFPAKNDFGGNDTGIDLVGLTLQGDYWAIQCKCFAEDNYIDKPAVDSFLATSSREFSDENNQATKFAQRLWISTTNRWNKNAEEAIQNQQPPVSRLNITEIEESLVDWEKLESGVHGVQARNSQKKLRPHQTEAVNKTHEHFKAQDRGKLVMACGTGKTFTSLRIAEKETNGEGLVLFLVPSIALLGQTLNEWSNDAQKPINAICICSDAEITKKKTKNEDSENYSVVDLAMPASTNVKNILYQFNQLKKAKNEGMTVVFSTYQSIEVIANAQKELLGKGFPIFDLIICDEAHRTTGVTLAGEDESAFTKVHDNTFIQAKKRLYMTATPRLYNDDVKSRAAQSDAVLCSMDNPTLYGEEIYRIGFGYAVEKGLLTDYKVLILTLTDKDVPPSVYSMLTGNRSEIQTDDLTKLVGCVSALSKQMLGADEILKETDPDPMKRAVAFCPNIKVSKAIAGAFSESTEIYIKALPSEKSNQLVSVQAKHIDGSMFATQRAELLSWLKGDVEENDCKVLSNVRCLSEGVDVPSLDAVMFLSARNSQVDVVQSVGRVMRLAPNKKYGYIIIPVVVPSDIEANVALNDNERYRVVWTVLNALRAHDDRFNATVNKIELNKRRPDNILIGRPETTFEDGRPVTPEGGNHGEIATQLALQFEQLKDVLYARLVVKVGDRMYWEQWAKDVAIIAERQIERIKYLIAERKDQRKAFDNFLLGLQKNINPSITEAQAVEMLAQHIITQPVFEALFEGYSFVKNNAVSVSMQKMLDTLDDKSMAEDSDKLQRFYESVKKRVEGIDNAEAKQKIIVELYDKFFKTAFPKMVEQLGIVYTPVEVVDFIIHSVNDILQKEFGRSISDENIHLLDPFTGTGTFITRLLQSGLIKPQDLERKYKYEIHANEIVLLAYYIAAINIENAYHDTKAANLTGLEDLQGLGYQSFEGICLTDTFQLGETDESEKLFSDMFPQNSKRVQDQQKAPLRIIMGNPPYSIGQKSANDNAQNQSYPHLDSRIAETYAKQSTAGLNKSLYDAYIKAFRWSTDRLDKTGGIICFVSNGAWLDGNSTDGFRKTLEKEFTAIYVFNLRGNQRTSGELSRKEGGKIFGSGSRTPISITLLVKNPEVKAEKASIHYHDIGDYLDREEKLRIVRNFKTFGNTQMPFTQLQPNEHGDWTSVRNDAFGTFIPLEPEKKFDERCKTFFIVNGPGILSSRDAWVYNYSGKQVLNNMTKMIDFYNVQLKDYKIALLNKPELKIEDFISTDDTRISWTRSLRNDLSKQINHKVDKSKLTISSYRPYCKLNILFEKPFIESPGLTSRFLKSSKDKIIVITGNGSSRPFSVLLSNTLPTYDLIEKGQCFPLYYYEENNKVQKGLFDDESAGQYTRKDAISDFILERAKKQYNAKNISKEDIFYYVYGFLHAPAYRETFANDLKKMLPRLPLVEEVRDFWAFSKAGRALADLHLNYEGVAPYKGVIVMHEPLSITDALKQANQEELNYIDYRVEKMRFPKKDQKDSIIFNSRIAVHNIPAKAYEYVVNGKSAIEWIMERYQITTHKESGIKNDPNDWAKEVGNPRYILDLLLSIINVSMQTVEIVNGLPEVKFE